MTDWNLNARQGLAEAAIQQISTTTRRIIAKEVGVARTFETKFARTQNHTMVTEEAGDPGKCRQTLECETDAR
jgi:hypothetical protein